MRRTLLAVLISAAALAIVPAAVVARGHERRHHARDHQRQHHRRHHHRVRHERLGHEPVSRGDAATAGTIKSFTGGVLTITRNDGSTVSGQVTDATRIRCDAPEPAEMRTDDHGSGGGDQRGRGDDRGGQGDRGDDRGRDLGEERACTTADLMPGAVVQEAELKISGAGSVWEEVELASQP
jgi:hypothetical protein